MKNVLYTVRVRLLCRAFHFIEADQKNIELQAWSTNTLENMCRVEGLERHYSVDQAGVWADCIRQRKAVVHNDYASLPNRKGLPEGHAPIVREMAVPVMRDGKIIAVLGVANKPENYTEGDVDCFYAGRFYVGYYQTKTS